MSNQVILSFLIQSHNQVSNPNRYEVISQSRTIHNETRPYSIQYVFIEREALLRGGASLLYFTLINQAYSLSVGGRYKSSTEKEKTGRKMNTKITSLTFSMAATAVAEAVAQQIKLEESLIYIKQNLSYTKKIENSNLGKIPSDSSLSLSNLHLC